MPSRYPVLVAAGLEQDFMQRHRRHQDVAEEVWKGLVRVADRLGADPFTGQHIQADRVPRTFRDAPNLWKLDLPHAFRALYAVVGRPGTTPTCNVLWIGDHKEYDRLFGYS